jgi:hypothetical protein
LSEREDLHNVAGAIPLLELIYRNNLEDSFHEVATVLWITVTISLMTAEPVRCLSSLKQIRTFLRNSMTQDHLTALAVL